MLKTTPSKTKTASRERFRTVSGRNQLVGKIVEVKISGLLAKVVLSIGDQRITSIITADAVREMQLRKGQTAAAIMKSTEVMITSVQSEISFGVPEQSKSKSGDTARAGRNGMQAI